MKKKYKVGDRIFYEKEWNGEVGDAIVTDVKHSTYRETGGRVVKYDLLFTSPHTCIEDYSLLDEDDEKVVEHKKTHADPHTFAEKFEAFMKENKFDIGQESIRMYLEDLIEEV